MRPKKADKFVVITKTRFNGRDNIPFTAYSFMEPISIRLYHGGEFVTKRWKTSYQGGGLSLHLNEDEVCYFEIVGWIKDLGYSEPGRIWFRKYGCSLYGGRKELRDDKDMVEFLRSAEPDGFYHLYVVHEKKMVGESSDTFVDSSNMMGAPPPHINNTVEGVFGEGLSTQIQNKNPISSSNTHSNHKAKEPTTTTPPTTVTTNFNPTSSRTPTLSKETDLLGSDLEGSENGSDSEDSDVMLSDDDFEDKEDDDLFANNVDVDISERVTRSLGGHERSSLQNLELEEIRSGSESEDDNDVVVESDDVLDESEEELRSDKGSSEDEEGFEKEFNPTVDFRGNINLSVGLKFPTPKVFRKAVQYHCIQEGYDYYLLHNGKNRVSAYIRNRCDCKWEKGRFGKCVCKAKKKCRFRINCKRVKGEASMQIRSMNLKHECGFQSRNKKVTSQYLAESYLEDWRDNPTWKLSAFLKKLRRDLGVEVKYYKCYYARRAFYRIYGDAAEQYKRVWDYVETVRKYNRGSSAIVKVEGIERPPPLFQRVYICLQPCKEGFMAGCRPILGVDGCHLRGPYPSILLTAVGKDGNQNIFPVAWAIVEVENSETWTWFLELLVNDLGSVADAVTFMHEREEPVTYMSDRQKGLLDAFNKVVPNAETRFCCRHIWANFKLKFPRVVYRQEFWKAAKSSTKAKFNEAMEAIKGINKEAFTYLQAIPANSWSRHAFSPKSKSGMLLNNCCESFNGVLREARAKPILTMMEWIRRWVMKRCCQKREGLVRFEGQIMPSVVKMVEKQKAYMRDCTVHQADVWEFEVDHDGESHIVNLEKRECGCFRWNLMGIPCCHALACMEIKRLNYEEYIHEAYHVAAYKATYAPAFHAMPGQSSWERSALEEPKPPTIKIMPGRPSGKKRKISAAEKDDSKRRKCSNCRAVGHRANKCKNPPQPKPQGPKNKGGRPKSNDAVTDYIETKKKRSKKKKNTSAAESQSSTMPTIAPQQQSQPSQASCISLN